MKHPNDESEEAGPDGRGRQVIQPDADKATGTPAQRFQSRSGDMPRAAEDPCSPAERREHARYMLAKPLLVIPILPDDRPDTENMTEGITKDLSERGLCFEVPRDMRMAGTSLLVAMEDEGGTLHSATVRVRHTDEMPVAIRIGTELADAAHDLLRWQNLTPTLDRQSYRFMTGLPEETLSEWAALGVLQPTLFDYVQLCPACQGLPTFRNGCRNCGSPRIAGSQLMHHFACAHVGLVEDYERDESIVCPKCGAGNLAIGADFEYLAGPHRCLDCDWSDTQLEHIAQCLRCGLRFPGHRALRKELIAFHVNRLDLLAFLDAT